MVRSVNCYDVFHYLMFSFNNYKVDYIYIHLSLGNRVPTFVGKSC